MNARWKRNVLSSFLNRPTSVLEECCKSLGRLFQAAGPAKLDPTVVRVREVRNLNVPHRCI